MKNKNSIISFVALSVVLLLTRNSAFAQAGSGDVLGTFMDTQSVIDSRNYVLTYEEWVVDPLRPASFGHGSDEYSWGMHSPSIIQYLIDDVEVPFEEWIEHPLVETNGTVRRSPPSENLFRFVPQPFVNQSQGEEFVLGNLYYFNGRSVTGTQVESIELVIETESDDIVFQQNLNLEIVVITVANIEGDPEASADSIYFRDFPQYGSFRVFEDEGTSVELLGEFNSLHFRGFGAIADPSVGSFGDVLGDVNRDGDANLLDVAPFVSLIVSGAYQLEADVNLDEVVDSLDIAPFVVILNGK